MTIPRTPTLWQMYLLVPLGCGVGGSGQRSFSTMRGKAAAIRESPRGTPRLRLAASMTGRRLPAARATSPKMTSSSAPRAAAKAATLLRAQT